VAEQEKPAQSAELIALIDRLEELLERSELSEIEVEAGSTGLVLRTPAALALLAPAAGAADAAEVNVGTAAAPGEGEAATTRIRAVVAPLTGVYYGSPSPGAEPYVREGTNVLAGQVIGLIEAMKLFNEIKSDVAGRVARICVESGALVKAKQPLIELEP
jgi:acetyl-CoA carboxylase biotin carboxyl carrier protein